MGVYEEAIDTIKLASEMSMAYYGNPLRLLYSGGKDSDTLLKLAIESGVTFEVQHHHTTADAPETVRYIRRRFAKLEDMGIKAIIDYPIYKGERVSMWSLIPQKLLPPTRITRYCCSVLKEKPIKDAIALLGIRKQESNRRKIRESFEILGNSISSAKFYDLDTATEAYSNAQVYPEIYDCNLITGMKAKSQSVANPIINWTERDVWNYLSDDEVNPLYKSGYNRVGCIGCPMGGGAHRYKEFARYPKYKQLYLMAFAKMLEVRKEREKPTEWTKAEEVFSWWMDEKPVKGQLNLFDGGDN